MCFWVSVLLYFTIMRPKLKITSSAYTREDILELIEEAHLHKRWRQKQRFEAILYAFSGKFTTDEVAELVGCSRASVTNWVRRWREGGPIALARNSYKPTRQPALTEEMSKDLFHHIIAGIICQQRGAELMKVWLKRRYGLDISLTAADYWRDRVWAKFEQGEYEMPEELPDDLLDIDLDEEPQTRRFRYSAA